MTKRRFVRWSLIFVIMAAFAVWLEPTRVVWGWLCGEAFYQGRPTSWWANQIEGLELSIAEWEDFEDGEMPVFVSFRPKPDDGFLRSLIGRFLKPSSSDWPKVLDGHVDSGPVLEQLMCSSSDVMREWAAIETQRIMTGENGPTILVKFGLSTGENLPPSAWPPRVTEQFVRIPGRYLGVHDISNHRRVRIW